MQYLKDMMKNFKEKHETHIKLYGADNDKRLTGIHETSSMTKFSYGTGNRACSFRIPTQVTKADGKGYIEDRRPASNIDPYVVSSIIFDTGCLQKSQADPMVKHYEAMTSGLKAANI